MSVKQDVTNERLNARFDNAFSLVNYAINLAKGLVSKGEEAQSNIANQVLEIILDSKDLQEKDEEEEEEYSTL